MCSLVMSSDEYIELIVSAGNTSEVGGVKELGYLEGLPSH